MSDCGKNITLKREGTDQYNRFIESLDPSSVKLNDFSLEEWMRFAYRFAQHVNYFNTSDFENPAGDWTKFFVAEKEVKDFLMRVETGKTLTPHLALYVSFIKLLEFSKKRFNQLTKRHLDFYYKNILQIEKLPATPDKVHLIFELAKNVTSEKISEETELDGGKDAAGVKRIYKITEEFVATKSTVASLKSVYNTHSGKKLKAAEKANSYDGMGADFPENEIKWWPFGYYDDANYPGLPDAKIGFAFATEVLEMQEGERNVFITAKFSTTPGAASAETLRNNLEIYCSGEKEWLGPFEVMSSFEKEEKNEFTSELNPGQKNLKIAFQVPKDEEPVVPYNSQVLGENFKTSLPICRILIKTKNEAGFELYRSLVENELENLNVEVDVRGVKSLLLESDIGKLNAEKLFYPFGTQPVKRSNLYIDCPELFKKRWTHLDVEIDWKNTPEKLENSSRDAFVDLYFAYRTDHLAQTSPSTYSFGMLDIEDVKQTLRTKNTKDDKTSLQEQMNVFPWFKNPDNLIVNSNNYFTAKIDILNKEEWVTIDGGNTKTLFSPKGVGFNTQFQVSNTSQIFEEDKNGPVRLSLNQSFLHELFPKIYALAFKSEEENVLIPNEPYTPMVEKISLDYKAAGSINLNPSEEGYSTNKLTLFHEHPFGQSEEHPWLKHQLNFLNTEDKKVNLLPVYCKGGELYIGLENAKPSQTVSLLVQVLEGSENPLASSFTGDQKAEWSVMCRNEWKNLDSSYMISNETDNFLKSGIVRFSIPKEATENNTKLPAGLVWVKVKIHKNYDAVCKVISIQAQAVQAKFSDRGNELSHLDKGLPAESVTKMVKRRAAVKGVSQPFSSFGGVPEESDTAYYRRISERLRHKNRAVTVWDYEHLVLQKLPEIFKVKCLNHTFNNAFLSPGNVVLIVIPDIANKNVFDIYQPRVSQAKLNEISQFINRQNSLHVKAAVANPDYEEVKVELKVKFYAGFDENFYQKKLNEDITRLLSPWAFERTENIDFGVTLHRSLVVNYIEKLSYVDYVEDVKLVKGTEVITKSVSPSNPRAILVSAKQHSISTKSKSCNEETTETQEKCQS